MENKKQTFRELYLSLPPTEQQRRAVEIIDRCNVSLWTILSWTTDPGKGGHRNPRPRTQAILAEMFGQPTDVLFPSRESKNA